jgi:hypothetical protein
MIDTLSKFASRLCLVVAIGVVSACAASTVPWSDDDPLSGLAWRDRRAFIGPDGGGDVVFASSPEAAREAFEAFQQLRVRLRTGADVGLGPGLIVAVDAEDDLLADDPQELFERLSRLHTSHTGRELARMDFSRSPDGGPELTESEREAVLREVVAMLPAAFRAEGSGLDLPAEAVERTEWVFLYPTDARLERSMWRAMSAVVPPWKRAVMTVVWAGVRGKMLANISKSRRKGLRDLVLAENGIEDADELAKRVRAAVNDEIDVSDLAEDRRAVVPASPSAPVLWITPQIRDVSLRDVVTISIESTPRVPSPREFDAMWSQIERDVRRRGDERVVIVAAERRQAAVWGVAVAEIEGMADAQLADLWREYGMTDLPEFSREGLRQALEVEAGDGR